ncbi:PIEZO1 isoform 6 [Pan troglodytes]|uniref:Piezo type mechanosensitive ion channel component 1 n=3 Tax=Pan TaxID=9596 RepID=A0A2I3SF51_PANTR|nr:PIEZO1 isoform 6 [Pan troglodytes]
MKICPFSSKSSIVLALKFRSLIHFERYPQPKGQKKKKIVKYGMGGLIILFLIAIIWFPLLFMSLVRSVVGVVNQPIDVTVTLKLGGYEPLFTMSAQQPSIIPFTAQAYEELSRQFDPQPLAMQFISQYSPEDIVTAQIEGSSGALWRISPPSRAQMKRELYNGTADITLRFTWNFQRDLAKGGTVEYANEKHMLALAPNSTARQQLASLLEGTSDQSVVIPNLFPKYIRAPNGPEANPVKQLQPNEEADYLGVRIQLRREQGAGATGFLEWWVIELQECRTDCNLLPMVIFSDKHHGAVRVHRAGHRQVRARILQRDLALHYVRGAAVRGPHPQALPGHLPGAGDSGAGAGGGVVRQAHLPLPLTGDHDQVDS